MPQGVYMPAGAGGEGGDRSVGKKVGKDRELENKTESMHCSPPPAGRFSGPSATLHGAPETPPPLSIRSLPFLRGDLGSGCLAAAWGWKSS